MMSGVLIERNDLSALKGIIGKRLIYTYDVGRRHELYVKNADTIDYRMHTGIIANRWVRDQKVHIARIAEGIFKISWVDPTGTCTSLAFNLNERRVYGTAYFPRWMMDHPEKSVCYQNDHIAEMEALRDKGPIHPVEFFEENAVVECIQDCGLNNESLIACGPQELPNDFLDELIRAQAA